MYVYATSVMPLLSSNTVFHDKSQSRDKASGYFISSEINLNRAFRIAITSIKSAFANFESEVKPAL